MMFALIDCNNFYASCEQVFNPTLRNKPLLILSNNDGCVIARSQQARELGIAMGAPAFQLREIILRHNVITLSSNFALYGDMSNRVQETLESFGLPIEVYSIDESFLHLSTKLPLEEVALALHNKVLQWTGISTSVGVAATKTLAKVANKWCKKNKTPIHIIKEIDPLLKTFPIDDVWGIGKGSARKLRMHGIRTAYGLKTADDTWIKKNLSVMGLKTALELRGIPCIDLEEVKSTRKSVVTSRTFKRAISDREELLEALSHFTAMSSEKLRGEGLVASTLHIYLRTKEGVTNGATITLPIATAHTPKLLSQVEATLPSLFNPNQTYKKAGIMLGEITLSSELQSDLFTEIESDETIHVLDKINAKYGKNTLFYAAEGTEKKWRRVSQNLSGRYTSSWLEIPRANCRE
jgi:DNA polymerase V